MNKYTTKIVLAFAFVLAASFFAGSTYANEVAHRPYHGRPPVVVYQHGHRYHHGHGHYRHHAPRHYNHHYRHHDYRPYHGYRHSGGAIHIQGPHSGFYFSF